jgi:hypothetical protein
MTYTASLAEIEASIAAWEADLQQRESLKTEIVRLESKIRAPSMEESGLLSDVDLDELKAARRYSELQALKMVRAARLELFKLKINALEAANCGNDVQHLVDFRVRGLLKEHEEAGNPEASAAASKLWIELREIFWSATNATEQIARIRGVLGKVEEFAIDIPVAPA